MITKISIENFKAFKRESVRLSNLNVFTGINGMGKSTFIQSLLLLRQSSAHFIPEINGLILKGGDSGIIDIGKGIDALNIHAENEFINFRIDVDNERYLDLSFKSDAESDVLPLNNQYNNLYGIPNNTSLFNSSFKYLKAERIAPQHNYRANLAEVKQNNFLGYRGENTPLFIALNKLKPVKLEGLQHEKAKVNNLISNIDAWMDEMTPGIHVNSTYYNSLDVVKLVYQFTVNDLTLEFSPPNVGFGITYTLPIVTAILSAQKEDLIIIENPETHLHPKGQAKLAALIAQAANCGVQIIVETHSDHIINGILIACKRFEQEQKGIDKSLVKLYHFYRGKDTHTSEIEPITILSNGKLEKQPKDFFDQTDKDLNYLLGF